MGACVDGEGREAEGRRLGGNFLFGGKEVRGVGEVWVVCGVRTNDCWWLLLNS